MGHGAEMDETQRESAEKSGAATDDCTLRVLVFEVITCVFRAF